MKSYEERMRDERDEAIADLERQVAALTKGRDLAVKQVGDVARQLGLCQIQRDELTEQVAALTKERDELKGGYSSELAVVCKKYLSSQAREQQLRELLRTIGFMQGYGAPQAVALGALALPTDDTALQARLKDEREKVAQMILNGSFLHTEAPVAIWAREVAAAIRRMT